MDTILEGEEPVRERLDGDHEGDFDEDAQALPTANASPGDVGQGVGDIPFQLNARDLSTCFHIASLVVAEIYHLLHVIAGPAMQPGQVDVRTGISHFHNHMSI